MPRRDARHHLLAAVLLGGLVASPTAPPVVVPAQAFDGAPASEEARPAPLPMFKNPKAALRAGLEGVRAGKGGNAAVAALRYAAEGGESLAQRKLGKMYAAGDGVPHDDGKAFEYFSQIVDGYDDDAADPREAPFIASAFVALGAYNLSGIEGGRIAANPERALDLFRFAAVNFSDADAQYNLARMFLDGSGTARDERQAARWLYLAADKGHVPSEALLGQLLFNGYGAMPPQRAKGLMWLSMARDGVTDKTKDAWILDLYARAQGAATDADRQVASLYLEDHGKRRN